MTASFVAGGAALLYAGGLVTLFLIRSRRHKAATGSSGFNGFARTPGTTPRVAGMCFAAALVLGLTAPLLAASKLAPYAWPMDNWTAWAGVWAGLILTAGGFATAVVAQNTMGASWRIGVDQTERTALVTHGVFSRVRNPIFTAMIAAQTGTALMAPTWPSIVGTVLLLVAVELQVRRIEEPYLSGVHGLSYTQYASQAGRFLPGVGRLTTSSQRAVPGRERVS
ncbi:MAG TPA: isoprenylcysteine carboxylmethyltransferase family protein [Propionibacteriaceae bacterium]|nr:isoprenylcysteine carboxylmethyltransferase family protein [Propionibacteriaceae bacterium]